MKKWDFILIILLILISFIPYGIKFFNTDSFNELYVEVKMDGKIVDKLPLDETSEGKSFTYSSELGTNVIKIENNTVMVQEASCPDHYCEHSKPISNYDELIVCLPNKFIVKVNGEYIDKNSDVDAVSN